ncbi:hypothetical protein HDV05_001114 [Chytridiales sp. JEL 0842]|nr:hypothetical protein HDV05_001114 [Chytridiales sp. JEL 0842]
MVTILQVFKNFVDKISQQERSRLQDEIELTTEELYRLSITKKGRKEYYPSTDGFDFKMVRIGCGIDDSSIKPSSSQPLIDYSNEIQKPIKPSSFFDEGLRRFHAHIHMYSEASHRLLLDLFISEALYQSVEETQASVKLRVEDNVSYETLYIHDKSYVTLKAKCDYTVGYSTESLSKFLCVQAKKDGFLQRDEEELLCQMGIVFASRRSAKKNHPSVYGALATANAWRFYRIDDSGKVQKSRQFDVGPETAAILTILTKILRDLIAATPTLSHQESECDLNNNNQTTG